MSDILKFIILKKEYPVLVGLLLLFILLLFKNPFSDRNLIPNFDPFPDSLNYIVPPLSLLKGQGFYISRERRSVETTVPPLYSLVLIPVFVINQDPRMFYFINFFLALSSFVLFYKVLQKITDNFWVISLDLLLYISNYFIYWYPNLAMSENLLLTLFMAGMFLVTRSVTRLNSILAGILTISFYATKYASFPLVIFFFLAYLIKIWIEEKNRSKKINKTILLTVPALLALSLLFSYEYFVRSKNIFLQIVQLLIKDSYISNKLAPSSQTTANNWFEISYMKNNLPIYLGAIVGKPMRFLWDYTPLVPQYIGAGGLLGLFLGMFYKNLRLLTLSLFLILISSIIFMSTFYSPDARYIYYAIPILILGFTVTLQTLWKKAHKRYLKILFYVLLISLTAFYLAHNVMRLKYQIVLNLKYAETPWSYISVLKMNEYFTKEKIVQGKKPVVISPMPPYYIDFYSNGNYSLLPLSKDQEFRGVMLKAWGPNDYSDLPALYKKYLESGYPVYVSIYGLGNEGYLHSSFDLIKERFNLTEVFSGCYNLCNIYKLEFK